MAAVAVVVEKERKEDGVKAECGTKCLQKRQKVAQEGQVWYAMAAEEAEGRQMYLILIMQ